MQARITEIKEQGMLIIPIGIKSFTIISYQALKTLKQLELLVQIKVQPLSLTDSEWQDMKAPLEKITLLK